MKQIKTHIVLMTCIYTFLCISCSKTDPSINLSNREIACSGDAQTITVPFQSALKWEAYSSESWIRVSPVSGPAGDNNIIISIDANGHYNGPRLGSVNICSEGIVETISISQTQFDEYELSTSSADFSFAGGELVVDIKHNIDVTTSVADDAKSWITYSHVTTKDADIDTYLFKIARNTSGNPRIGKVTFSGSNIEKDLIFTQDGIVFYIDERGINQGAGVYIDGKIWAPVNCGYDKDFAPKGLYYQWGRKHGQNTSHSVANIWNGENGAEDSNTVYRYGSDDENSGSTYERDWIIKGDNTFWNKGTEDSPIKNEAYDPCPKGWRIPTMKELSSLSSHSYYYSGLRGNWLSGSKEYSDDMEEKVFFPAMGHFKGYGNCELEVQGYKGFYWSSTVNKKNYAEYLNLTCTTMVFTYSLPYRVHAQSVRCIHE